MQELKNKVAVVTGAASGIGLAVVKQLAREGMRLVMADIEEAALQKQADAIRAEGTEVLAVRVDVSRREDMERLAETTQKAFGAVHLLVNNAGVVTPVRETAWESSWEDWDWIVGVNFWGVVHGTKIFVPLMQQHGEPAHIVNVSSIMGLVPNTEWGIYQVTKTAIVSLSEHLYHTLARQGSNIGVSVICPALVATHLLDAARNKPDELRRSSEPMSEEKAETNRILQSKLAQGLPPEELAEHILDAVRNGDLYVITTTEHDENIINRFNMVMNTPRKSSSRKVLVKF